MANNVQQAPNMGMIAPDLQAQQVALQRQQQIADMLKQQGITPIETGQMVTGAGPARAVPVSGLQVLAKMLQAGAGGYMQQKNDAKALDIGQQMNTRMGSMLDGTLPPQSGAAPSQAAPMAPAAPQDPQSAGLVAALQGAPRTMADGSAVPNRGPTNEAAAAMDNFAANPSQMPAAPQPAAPPVAPGPPDMSAALRASVKKAYIMGNPELANKLTEQAWSTYAPNETTKMAVAAGSDPAEANRKALEKALLNAPINAREGSTLIDPLTRKPFFNAPNKDGVQYQFSPDGQASAAMVPGFGAALTDYTRAKELGKNLETLAPVAQSVTNPDGTTQPASIAATLHPGIAAPAAPNQGFPAGTRLPAPASTNPTSRIEVLRSELDKATQAGKASDVAALTKEIANLPASERGAAPQAVAPAPQGVGAPFGRQQGAEAAQAELSKRWIAQVDANKEAQTTSSYLQSIRGLSEKAIVGPQSDKLAYANGLLAMAGIPGAKDIATANNLMDKYQNQITTRLGGGAGGTDASRAIIAAAYPGSKMTKDAIGEAVGNLVGANEMIKARTSLLSPHANARDPVAYQQQEQAFDQAADPRVWQWRSISDPAQRKAFAQSILKQDPTFPARIQKLEALGVFK